MREILFRGKRVDNGTWAYGDLTHCDDEMEINSESHGENGGYIIPETVGQYTGLKDKIGKKIFEGDIVRLQNLKLLYEIYWDKKEARYKARNGGCVSPLCNDYNVFVEEAVGNVFDNPELLEGEK